MPRRDPEARREYQREYQRKWYQRNRALQMTRVMPGNRRARETINNYVDQVKSRPCADCGGQFPAFMMDFDHVRGAKVAEISRLRGARASRARLEAELAKCEVVCANCHRRRTQLRLLGIEVSRSQFLELFRANECECARVLNCRQSSRFRSSPPLPDSLHANDHVAARNPFARAAALDAA